jgi:hypothetical protein
MSIATFKQLVEEYEDTIGKTAVDEAGNEFEFFGIVWGEEDLYYGLSRINGCGMTLVSCVMSLENVGYTFKDV